MSAMARVTDWGPLADGWIVFSWAARASGSAEGGCGRLRLRPRAGKSSVDAVPGLGLLQRSGPPAGWSGGRTSWSRPELSTAVHNCSSNTAVPDVVRLAVAVVS